MNFVLLHKTCSVKARDGKPTQAHARAPEKAAPLIAGMDIVGPEYSQFV